MEAFKANQSPQANSKRRDQFADPADFKCAADTVVEGGDTGFDFHDGVTDGFEAKAAIGLREDLAFYNAGIVTDGDEFHLVPGDLMMRAISDDQPADR